MLTVCTWLWGSAFAPGDAAKLAAGVRRHLRQPHRFVIVTDHPRGRFGDWPTIAIPEEDRPLLAIPGCFARLRMFDPAWQLRIGAEERILCIDLDSVITGPLDPVVDRPEPFVILQGGNLANPCPYNGALIMLRAGTNRQVWSEFSLDAASAAPFYEFPDDQGWLHHMLPGAPGWAVGSSSGVYVFRKRGWPPGDALPVDARIVTFSGRRQPRHLEDLAWVRDHWRL